MSISANVYVKLICALERADQLQADANGELVSMSNVLSDTLTTFERKAAMSEEIENERARIAQIRARAPASLIDAVKRLQAHVTKYNGSVNSFLTANSLTVSPYFAGLSEVAGYKIASELIGSSCL